MPMPTTTTVMLAARPHSRRVERRQYQRGIVHVRQTRVIRLLGHSHRPPPRSVNSVRGSGKDEAKTTPLGLPITYHVDTPRPTRGSTFGDAKCEPTEDAELDTCTIREATEVYDRRCPKCAGNRLVMSMTRSGGGKRYKETISTCQTCGGAGVVRVATNRIPADFAGGDSEAAHFEHFPTHEESGGSAKSEWDFRPNIFAEFEKEAEMKRSQDEEEDLVG